MFVGDPTARSKADVSKFRQLTYTCMANTGSRSPETSEFPSTPCAYGIMANVRFPTCWDGVNLDSPNHSKSSRPSCIRTPVAVGIRGAMLAFNVL